MVPASVNVPVPRLWIWALFTIRLLTVIVLLAVPPQNKPASGTTEFTPEPPRFSELPAKV